MSIRIGSRDRNSVAMPSPLGSRFARKPNMDRLSTPPALPSSSSALPSPTSSSLPSPTSSPLGYSLVSTTPSSPSPPSASSTNNIDIKAMFQMLDDLQSTFNAWRLEMQMLITGSTTSQPAPLVPGLSSKNFASSAPTSSPLGSVSGDTFQFATVSELNCTTTNTTGHHSTPGFQLARQFSRKGGQLSRVSSYYRKKKESKSIKHTISSFLESFEGTKRSWPELFHQRMLVCKNILDERQREYYHDLFESYKSKILRKSSSTIDSRRVYHLNELTGGFLEYLENHVDDPDNCLIGLYVEPSLGTQYAFFSAPISGTELILNPLKIGELLIVRANETSTFGRIKELLDESNEWLLVSFSPDEKTNRVLNIKDVQRLPRGVKQMLGSSRSMNKLVKDPTDSFYAEMAVVLLEKTCHFLRQRAIDTGILEDIKEGRIKIVQLAQVEANLEKLTQTIDNPFAMEQFMHEMEVIAAERIALFVQSLDPTKIMPLTREATINQLKQNMFPKLGLNLLQGFIQTCDTALNNLHQSIQDIKSGSRKRVVTSWWLSLIENRCHTFLDKLRFDHDAVPDDYIQEPPKDFAKVRANLELIRKVLDPANDVYGVKDFIAQLKKEIYPKVDQFIEDAHSVLYLTLQNLMTARGKNLHHRFNGFNDINVMEEEINKLVHTGATIDNSITNLIADLKYLKEMKRMENLFSERKNTLEMTNVVPMAGLILGRFHIVENELSTVLDVWRHMDQQAATSSTSFGECGAFMRPRERELPPLTRSAFQSLFGANKDSFYIDAEFPLKRRSSSRPEENEAELPPSSTSQPTELFKMTGALNSQQETVWHRTMKYGGSLRKIGLEPLTLSINDDWVWVMHFL